jgi:hypothetical protein
MTGRRCNWTSLRASACDCGDTAVAKTKTGKALERRVAQAYRQMGARVKHDVELAGRQIDVYVELETPDRAVHRIAIETKDYSSPVGSPIVGAFSGIVENLRHARLDRPEMLPEAGAFDCLSQRIWR